MFNIKCYCLPQDNNNNVQVKITRVFKQVKSCRVSKECYSNDCLRIPEHRMRLLIDNKNYFCCNLTIKRRVDYRTVTDQNNSMHADDIVNN